MSIFIKIFSEKFFDIVGIGGLEPPTLRVSDECSNQLSYIPLCGGTGIRTPDTFSSMPVFKTGAINRSAIPPFCVTRENRTPTESATNFRPTIRP
jgi:hypothetical protein